MTEDDIIRMAREADLLTTTEPNGYQVWIPENLERFANLVAAAEREKVARWQIGSGYTTGHGDTIEDLLVELEWQVRESERDKWEPVIAAVIRELPERMRGDKGNAPGHAHEIAGIWDSDNGDIAGTKCAWCAAWNTALEVIRARGQHD